MENHVLIILNAYGSERKKIGPLSGEEAESAKQIILKKAEQEGKQEYYSDVIIAKMVSLEDFLQTF